MLAFIKERKIKAQDMTKTTPPLLPPKNPTIATKADPIKDWVRGISAKRFNLLNFQDLLEK
jgi:hypothetical protein